MKIAHVVCVFPPYRGGMGNVAYNYCLLLARRGHEISVFTTDYKNKLNKTKDNKLKIQKIKPLLKYGNGAFIPALFFKLKKFDIVHLHVPYFGGAEVVWAAKLTYSGKFKLVISYHMDITGLPILIKALSIPSKLIYRSLYARADAIICASLDYIKTSQIRKYYENYKDKFYEIPFGVDAEKFKPKLKSSMNNNNFKNLKILFVGGLDKAHYFKGVDVLLKAFAKLQINNCRLTIIGSGELRPEYERQAKILGIGERVYFYGNATTEELIDNYQKADVFVLPSINSHEAFGLVLLEAMACGTPVIASNLPGVRSVFENGKQGLFVEPGNASDLADKLFKMLSNNRKRKKMGAAGRDLVLKKYGWKNVADNLIRIYENLHNQQSL